MRRAAQDEDRDIVAWAAASLARSLEPLHDSVAGTNAGTGESRAMKAQNLSTSLGEGRDAAPSLAHPSQKTKTWSFTQKS